jgi:hypothetical protein
VVRRGKKSMELIVMEASANEDCVGTTGRNRFVRIQLVKSNLLTFSV